MTTAPIMTYAEAARRILSRLDTDDELSFVVQGPLDDEAYKMIREESLDFQAYAVLRPVLVFLTTDAADLSPQSPQHHHVETVRAAEGSDKMYDGPAYSCPYCGGDH